ncbi:hypothetical protein Y032_0002g712 [Ancylostoma ceylanicum]|uniref:SXP/RAL-2 family protein Ani s 5-like cation-binding domain-containing protein n=1 Tax=Ancylostoma ceylanicum TaxID=53326 RepID=A0A016W0B8_9BILA|nr:hypothetical protein Y032_0002g712 [Ancylostoma ceylanicum]
MNYKVLFVFAVLSTTYAIWPDVLKPDESAALDFVMRISRMNIKDLKYIQNQQLWGNEEEAMREKAKNENPPLYEKMMHFLEKYHKLSEQAKKYVDDVVLVPSLLT